MANDTDVTEGSGWQYKKLPEEMDAPAPDGSEVRLLCTTTRGNMAHFLLPAHQTSKAVAHRTIVELWYIIGGVGEMWMKCGSDQQDVKILRKGVSLSTTVGTHFQFRNTGSEPLEIVGVAIPAWPGDGESYDVEGKWLKGSY